MEKDKKIKKLPIVIGIIFLAILVIGAAFSYYIVTNSNTSTTTAARTSLGTFGTVSLTQGVSNIYLDTTPEQMLEDNADTDYYGMDDEIEPATTPQEHILATITAIGGDSDAVYKCKMEYSLAVSQINGTSNSAYAALTADDAEFVIDVYPDDNSDNSALGIADSYTLRQGNGYLNKTGKSFIRITGNTGLDIIGDLVFHNLDDDQTSISDIGLNVAFNITSFSCEPTYPTYDPSQPELVLTTDSGTSGLSVGDLVTLSYIGIPDQNFYVISTNDNETTLLSQYNLLVGNCYSTRYSHYGLYYTYSELDEGYALQSSNIVSNQEARGALVPFSGTNYWDDSVCQYTGTTWGCTGTSGLKNDYTTNGASYNGSPKPYVYDSSMSSVSPSIVQITDWSNNYGRAQNNGYTIAYFVEMYIDKIGIDGIGRLLSYEERNSLPNGISTSPGFWIGSATSSDSISGSIFASDASGVRPVIVVPTVDITKN